MRPDNSDVVESAPVSDQDDRDLIQTAAGAVIDVAAPQFAAAPVPADSIGRAPGRQLALGLDTDLWIEDSSYLSRQLITYIGNKRALLPQISNAIGKVKNRLGKDRIRALDAFSGSGVVSRLLKSHSTYLVTNDIEDYAAVVARCFLANRSQIDTNQLADSIAFLEAHRHDDLGIGFIEEFYAPRDERHITVTDRVFYTRQNARLLDNYRRLINEVPPSLRDFCLGPLLSEASVHANTSGVFKGFYKDKATGVGRFGGTNADALQRILGEIRLLPPVLSRFECEVEVLQGHANSAVRKVRDLDLAYFDPPYNQHPYGSNYFMLNLLVHYQRPQEMSVVSGIPVNWRRSDYNVRARALPSLRDLFLSVDARFLLVSFNNEGFVSRQEMEELLAGMGRLEVMETRYNAFRGSRNLRNREIHVTEQLFLVERR